MQTENDNLIALSTAAQVLNILKSTLLYYYQLKMITPVKKVGKTLLFDQTDLFKRLDAIKEARLHGISLKDIKNKILPTL